MLKDREDIDKIRRIKKEIKLKRGVHIVMNIVHNTIFITIMFLIASLVFGIPITNKIAFIIFVPMAGIARFIVNDLQYIDEINDINETFNMMAGHIIALDKAINKIQKLSTDEDILKNTKREVFSKRFKCEEEE